MGQLLGEDETITLEDAISSGESTAAADQLEKRELKDRSRSARRVPKAQRQAFVLHILEAYELYEVAMIQDRDETEVQADIEAATFCEKFICYAEMFPEFTREVDGGVELLSTAPAMMTTAFAIVAGQLVTDVVHSFATDELEPNMISSGMSVDHAVTTSIRELVARLSTSFLAISATCFPWNRAIASSFALRLSRSIIAGQRGCSMGVPPLISPISSAPCRNRERRRRSCPDETVLCESL
ncbi:MAG: hypothetical protein R3C56_10970 [Pirellulaceae bacterium]